MKVSFFTVKPTETEAELTLIHAATMQAVPREGEVVVIDKFVWLVDSVAHEILRDDEAEISISLRPVD